jgi:Zn-dependent protease/CBS domain-containing protein
VPFPPKEATMTRQTIPIGRIFGIPIGLDYSWFLVFALFTWMLAGGYFPAEFRGWPWWLYWVTGAVTTILFFASVLLHELGHSVVALRYKIPVRSITLFIFGGVAQIASEPPSAVSEFVIAVAGPATSFALAGLFAALKPAVATVEPLFGMVKYLAYINFALALFNLIPGFPLDGGRVFRAAVWAATGNLRRATITAANVGRFFGFTFILIGAWQVLVGNLGGGLWIAFIGWFLDGSASAQIRQTVFQGALAGHTVAQAMSTSCAAVPDDLTLQQLVDDHILSSGRRCFLVNRGSETIGLMTLHRVKEVGREHWAGTTAAQVMLPLAAIKSLGPDTGLWDALQLMDRDGVNQLPVVVDHHVVGMLSREDVITYLSTVRELGA